MHSPFPWRTHTQQPCAVFDATGKRIINPYPNVDLDTAADNAALIAAIPQMVEALEATLCELTACASQLAARGLKGHPDDSVSRAQSAARAVLAKVKELRS